MFVLLFAALKVAGQTTGYFRYDTVKIMKQNGTCELYVINKTKDSLGLLTNVGGGLTRFIKPKMLNDSSIIIGLDTIIIRGASGGQNIANTSLTADGDYVQNWNRHQLIIDTTTDVRIYSNAPDWNFANNKHTFLFEHYNSVIGLPPLSLKWALRNVTNSFDSTGSRLVSDLYSTYLDHYGDGGNQDARISLDGPNGTVQLYAHGTKTSTITVADVTRIEPADSLQAKITPAASADSVLGVRSFGFGLNTIVKFPASAIGASRFGIDDSTGIQHRHMNMQAHRLNIDSLTTLELVAGIGTGNVSFFQMGGGVGFGAGDGSGDQQVGIYPDVIEISPSGSDKVAKVRFRNSDSLLISSPSSIAVFKDDTLKAISVADLSALVGGGGSQSLQQVLTVGNSTSQHIISTANIYGDSSDFNVGDIHGALQVGDTILSVKQPYYVHGTSISAGTGSSKPYSGYLADAIQLDLHNNAVHGSNVVAGIYGFISSFANYTSNSYFWMADCGINDFSPLDTVTYKTKLGQIIDTLKIKNGWPDERILILSPPYSPPSPGDSIFIGINERVVAAHGGTTLDIFHPMKTAYFSGHTDLLNSDSVHPTDKGQQFIFNIVHNAVKNIGYRYGKLNVLGKALINNAVDNGVGALQVKGAITSDSSSISDGKLTLKSSTNLSSILLQAGKMNVNYFQAVLDSASNTVTLGGEIDRIVMGAPFKTLEVLDNGQLSINRDLTAFVSDTTKIFRIYNNYSLTDSIAHIKINGDAYFKGQVKSSGVKIVQAATASAVTPFTITTTATGGALQEFFNGNGANELKITGLNDVRISLINPSTTDPAGGGYNVAFGQFSAGTDYAFIGMNYGTSAGPYLSSQLFYRTVTSTPHVWYVGTAEKMRLNAMGLGIGTTTPSFGLHINRTLGANKDSLNLSSTVGTRQMLVIDTSTGKFQRMNMPTGGSWTPTLSADANVTGTPTLLHATYTRVGNIVTCYITLTVVPTANTTQTEVGITLPVASSFTDANDVSGSGSGSLGNGRAVFVLFTTNTTSDRATLIFESAATTGSIITGSFQYTVL